MSTLFSLKLKPGDLRDVEAVARDRFQSPRARKRCHALNLLNDGRDPRTVHEQTGVTEENQEHMLKRLHEHGVQAAIFGSPRRPEQRLYDWSRIAAVVNDRLKRRPPPGCMRWNLKQVVVEVRNCVPGAEDISKELLRQIIKKELRITSIRVVEPFWMQQVRRSA